MIRWRVAGVGLVLLAVGPAADSDPRTEPVGIVVETVVQGWAGEKPDVRPGDVLISWERVPNPPANPKGSHGPFLTPFDLFETCSREAPRAKGLTLVLTRSGARVRSAVSELQCDIETRPAFGGPRLKRYEEGRRLSAQGDLAKATDVWRALAGELSSSGDPLAAAWMLRRVAAREAEAQRVDAAVETIDQAIAQARAAGRADVEAQLWGFKGGEILAAAKRFREGDPALRQALAIREREDPDGLSVAQSLNSLNWVSEPRGSAYEADQSRALRIAQKLAPGSALEANCQSGVGIVVSWRGDARAGRSMIRRALEISESLDPRSRHVLFHVNNLCAFGPQDGDLATAESFCERLIAEVSWRPPEEQPNWIALGYHNTAFIAADRGDLDRAASLLRKALAIREKSAPGTRGLANNLQHLGLVEMRRGNYEEAEKLIRQGAAIHESVAQLNSPYRSDAMGYLAEIAFRRKDLQGSLKQLREAAAFWDDVAPDGSTASKIYDDMGQVLTELGETREAEVLLRRALKNRRRSSEGGTRLTAESSHNLGMLLWKTGRLREAEAELRRSVEDLEAQHSKLGGPPESRSSFTAEFADYYRDYLRLLVELERQDDAFLLLERFRAGSFRETLARRDIAAPEEVPPDLEQARRSANAEYDRLQREIEDLDPATQAVALEERLARLEQLRREQSSIAEAIRRASPRYGSIRYPRPLDVAGARSALSPGTVLLSYVVGREESYLFVLSDGSEGALSVYTLPIGETKLRASVDASRRLVAWSKPGPELAAGSRTLYETLVAPARERIARADRLLIVADGPLHKLPWAALAADAAEQRGRFLGEWKPIHTAPSVTVYAELKKPRPHPSSSPSVTVAAFGDPKYPATSRTGYGAQRGAGDSVASDAEPPSAEIEDAGDPQVRSVLRSGFDLAPLPESRAEVAAIAALYAPRSAAYFGADATEERAASVGQNVPLIHYACHAVVNERFPLDSALVLTIPEKPVKGRGNGLLQAWEIFERMRIDADLVTLSACESGLGREMAGEGLIGLTRAFQYAGARSVLASLWKVDDKATAELMKRFYGYMKAGRPKDEALQLAQIDLLRSPAFSQPKHWAAFQISGDWE
jgi:CHAT domain-containing protein/tetratricopeptide (TPR) repeat protein